MKREAPRSVEELPTGHRVTQRAGLPEAALRTLRHENAGSWGDAKRRLRERADELAAAVEVRPRAVLGAAPFPMARPNLNYVWGRGIFWSTRIYRRQLAGLKYHWAVRTSFDRWTPL